MKNIDFSNIELSFSERITLHLLPIIKSNRFFRYQTLDYLNRLGLLDRDHGVYTVNRWKNFFIWLVVFTSLFLLMNK